MSAYKRRRPPEIERPCADVAPGSYFAGREATYGLSTISTSFPSSTSALPSIAPPW